MVKSLRMTYTESSNIKVTPSECPLGLDNCYENLGEFKKECSMSGGFYMDTKTTECKFDELSEENQVVLLKLYARRSTKNVGN